jgi:hypothetical protein
VKFSDPTRMFLVANKPSHEISKNIIIRVGMIIDMQPVRHNFRQKVIH